MLGVERGTVRGEGWEMDHIRFGAGGRVLVILPGLGDGLRTVRETALPLAAACREYGRERKVYLFSRRRGLEPGATIRGMAEDQAEAMKKLGLWVRMCSASPRAEWWRSTWRRRHRSW